MEPFSINDSILESYSNDSFKSFTDYAILKWVLPQSSREVFLWVFIVISVCSVIGNLAAIYATCRSKSRCLQKTCIISLSLSDLLSTTSIATINLTSFLSKLMTWPLGEFFCKFLPMCQCVGIFASSATLVFIAMDRYRNVVKALNKRWNPRLTSCIIVSLLLWLVAFGVSQPVYNYFLYGPINIQHQSQEIEATGLCVTFNKKDLGKYYLVMVVVIFLPLLVIFLWFYYNIALLVWNHRKPLQVSPVKTTSTSSESFSCPVKSSVEKKPPAPRKTQDSIRVERKIRTFKIVITLMVVFIVFRLPYFAVYIYKLMINSDNGNRAWNWYLNYSFLALHIVNCCLNPLLYTFLNQSLQAWNAVRNFFWEVCCYCCSDADFDNLENRNPFTAEQFDKKVQDAKGKEVKTLDFKHQRY